MSLDKPGLKNSVNIQKVWKIELDGDEGQIQRGKQKEVLVEDPDVTLLVSSLVIAAYTLFYILFWRV